MKTNITGNSGLVRVLLTHLLAITAVFAAPAVRATPPGCAQNLIINGSFELPGVFGNAGPGRQQYVAPSLIGGWTVGGMGDIFLHKCPEMDAGPTFCPAQEGSFYLDLSGSGPPHATVYQDFPTTPGSTYQLSFYIGASIQTPPAPTINVQVMGGATLLNTSVTPLAPGTNINWTLQTFAFVADSSLTRLQFTDTSSDDENASFVDNARVVSEVDPCATPTPPPTGGNGSFAIGDVDAVVGRQVYFWGSQWAKTNRLSGGAAPSAFKGFANSIGGTVPNCGGVWRSDPGNSSGPPNSVPSFITVIASSSITKSGSVINGNNKKIVVVRTDPGYGPNPGHEGTGIVMSVTCQ